MSSTSRTSQFQHLHRILKKHYKPVFPDKERQVLEQLLFACCLENAHYDAADEAFLGLVHNFFDWNEVRVSTVRELAEVMPRLPDPLAAAHRVKRVLQHVFESTYSFELEGLRKLTISRATKELKAIDGCSPFAAAYVIQSVLEGHAIPLDDGAFGVLRVVQLATDKDREKGVVPALERAIPKASGIEFGSLLHQLGADFVANPYSSRVREILLEIDPTCRDRLPKRRSARQAEKQAEQTGDAAGRGAQGGTGPVTETPAAAEAGSKRSPSGAATKKAAASTGSKQKSADKSEAGDKPRSGKKSTASGSRSRSKRAGSGSDRPAEAAGEDQSPQAPSGDLSKKKPR